MEIHQIVLTAERRGRLPLFSQHHHYIEALHRLGRVFKGSLALFALIAEHLHLIALMSRLTAGRAAQAALLTLRPIVKTPLARSRVFPVEGRGHMYRLVDYEVGQPVKHGMPGHPALWPGSCLPELVGARIIPGLTLRIGEALPTFNLRQALRKVGLTGDGIAPAELSTLRAAGASRLMAATAAVFGARPDLRGNLPAARKARRALVQLVDQAGISAADLRAVSGLDHKTLWRLRRQRVPGEHFEAIGRRVTLENLVQRAVAA